MIKLIINFSLVVVIGIMGTIIAANARASDRLDAYVAAYEAGTLYQDDAAYREYFATSSERSLTIEPGPATPTRDLGTFIASYTVHGERKSHQGILMIEYDAATQQPIRTHTWPLKRHRLDRALAGQGADLATTAVGTLLLGATEVNQLFGPIFAQSPVLGLVVMGGAKYWLIQRADASDDYLFCVGNRESAARMGFGFAANNVAGVGAALLGAGKAAIPIGLVAGFAVYALSDEHAREDAAVRCFEAAEARPG